MEIPDHIQTAVANEFAKRYPEFYGSPQNAKVLSELTEKYTDAGYPFAIDTLASAYHQLRAAGALEQPEEEVIEVSGEEWTRKHQIETLAINESRMSDWELERNLRSAGIYVP